MSEMKVALKGLTCANCAGKIEDTLSKLSETQEFPSICCGRK